MVWVTFFSLQTLSWFHKEMYFLVAFNNFFKTGFENL